MLEKMKDISISEIKENFNELPFMVKKQKIAGIKQMLILKSVLMT